MLVAVILVLISKTALDTWYGPKLITFDLPAHGNPFDARDNDIRVRFTMPGHSEERLAYYDGSHWDAVFLTQTPGDYTADVVDNGRILFALPDKLDVYNRCTTDFVRIAPNRRDFEIGSKRFWPVGHDLAWGSPDLPPLTKMLADLGASGCTWARIWATNFDGKNLYWPSYKQKMKDGFLNTSAAAKWDAIVKAADIAAVRFQWVLFHHGSFATIVDPEWKDSPWNKANGGFLSDPKLFFTDPNAIRHAKDLLRYIVARYAHETSIMGWELFNEVENTDAGRAGDWPEIGAWHREMADYLRSIDPYHHLITTSSDSNPALWPSMDYYQMHGYPEDLGAMLESDRNPGGKPFFFGEVGLSHDHTSTAETTKAIRDGIWTSYLAGDSGAGMYWYWDQIQTNHLYPVYERSNEVLRNLGGVDPTSLSPIRLTLTSSEKANLSVSPGVGWGPSTKADFTLPRDQDVMGKLSVYIQGTAHKDMGSSVTFRFTAPTSGAIKLKLGTVSRGGAQLTCLLDGQKTADVQWPAASGDHPADRQITLPYAAGPHVATISNVGPDWAQIVSYTFTDLGSPLHVQAARTERAVVFRLQKVPGASAQVQFCLGGLPLEDGDYALRRWAIDGASSSYHPIQVRNGKVNSPLTVSAGDEIDEIVKS